MACLCITQRTFWWRKARAGIRRSLIGLVGHARPWRVDISSRRCRFAWWRTLRRRRVLVCSIRRRFDGWLHLDTRCVDCDHGGPCHCLSFGGRCLFLVQKLEQRFLWCDAPRFLVSCGAEEYEHVHSESRRLPSVLWVREVVLNKSSDGNHVERFLEFAERAKDFLFGPFWIFRAHGTWGTSMFVGAPRNVWWWRVSSLLAWLQQWTSFLVTCNGPAMYVAIQPVSSLSSSLVSFID